MMNICWASDASGICQYPCSMSSFLKHFAPRKSAISASWFGMTPGTFSICLLTARWSLTKRNPPFLDAAIAALAHTACRLQNTRPSATRVPMHVASHAVLIGEYIRPLAFTTFASGLNVTVNGSTRAAGSP